MNISFIRQTVICSILFFVIWPFPTEAQWSWNPAVNNAICTATENQNYTQICCDGSGGAIITWRDERSGTDKDIYAQRISGAGVVQWTANGNAICTATENQENPKLFIDGSGGAIITWSDNRSGTNWDIYTQRISDAGVVQWTVNGNAICTASGDQHKPQICSDGSVGAIIVWHDWRLGTNTDIYAQRISGAGVVQWPANGNAICTASEGQYYHQISSDGSGGAIITWQDKRSGSNLDIYAQRNNVTGDVLWTANGNAICTASGEQGVPKICSDGSSGAIITWLDPRLGAGLDIYAQRISGTGMTQWTANGVAICTASGGQQQTQICNDGSGGAIITWSDRRSGTNWDIYAQRISGTGVVLWTADGNAICTASGDQGFVQICSDGSGGAIISWKDGRSGSNSDIYAQRISGAGIVQWTANGVAISTVSGDQEHPQISSDGSGGAIITWWDKRSGSNLDIYTSKVNSSGQLVPVELLSFSGRKRGSTVTLTWRTATEVNNYGFDVERKGSARPWETIDFAVGHGTSNMPKNYEYQDQLNPSTLKAGRLFYRLRQIDMDGKCEYSPVVEVSIASTPQAPELSQNYPNPFNPTTTISYSLPERMQVSLVIIDPLGREVQRIYTGQQHDSGHHSVHFDAGELPSGIYFYRLTTPETRITRKMLLIR